MMRMNGTTTRATSAMALSMIMSVFVILSSSTSTMLVFGFVPQLQQVTPYVFNPTFGVKKASSSSSLYMSDGGSRERSKKTKKGKGLKTMERTETRSKEEKRDESQWRVLLHNDEVHTFNYVVDALTKILPEYNKKKAFDLCVVVHGSGKGTVTTVWKEKAEQYCMGLQRHGLTVSIAPDKNFKGGGDGDGGGDGGDGPGPA